MKKHKWLLVFMFAGVVAWSCGGNNPVSSKPVALMDDTGVTAEGIDAVVQANNRFALDVYAQLKQDGGNVFLSPYSISTALAMAYEGARGQTAEEMAQVFYFLPEEIERRAAFAAIHNQLNAEDAEHELRVANALWAQREYAFLETYIHTLQNYYAADATNLDFANATEDARKMINGWVEGNTNNKIKDLFPQGSLSTLTRLVLTNAVYFKGEWAAKFDKGKTRDEPFYVTPQNTVNVPMMRLTGSDANFKYAEYERMQVLEMPYQGKKLSMLVFLPARGELAVVENELSMEKLAELRTQLWMQRVDVFLPRFKFETKYFMNETLKKMGMPTAFTEGADFSGMDGTNNLAIQTVIHQAFVDVNEEGTEAAAATGVGVAQTSVPQIHVFRADRPFVFVIQDVERGNILFMGRVANPKS